MPPHLDLSSNPLLLAFGALLLTAGLLVYSRLVRQISDSGGKVRTAEFSLPDLLVCVSLTSTIGWLIATQALSPAKETPAPINVDQLVPNSLVFVVLVMGIGAFASYRGLRLSRLVGIAHVSTGRAIVVAFGLLLAALPILWCVGWLTKQALQGSMQEQELVQLFRKVAQNSDSEAILKIVLAGVVIAPLWEEFLFRGYFYGVFKRYFGSLASALLTAALFAAFHTNLASLPSLFALALCFTIAYEATGSLLVPIGMHALFNLTQLAFLYLQATRVAG